MMAIAADPETLVRLACQDLEKNDLAAGEAKALRALEANREHAGAWTVIGMVLQAKGRHDDAIRVFNSLTLKDPGSSENWANLGVALREAKRLDEALSAYERALAIAPPSARTLYNVGLIQIQRLDYVAAYAVLKRAVELAPTDAWIHCTFAECCHDFGNFDEAIETLENWQSFDGLTAQNMAEMAHLLVSMGEHKRAQPAIDWLSTHPPDGGRAALTLVNVLERMNKLDDARTALQRAKTGMTSDRPDPDLVLAEAVLAQREHRDDEAYRLVSRALEEPIEFIRRHNLLFPLAKSLDALGRHDEAYAALTEAHRSQVAYLQASLGKTPADESPTMSLTQHGVVAEDLARYDDADAPPASESPIFIVGFPRSGTTLLEQTLDAHPALVSMDERPFLNRAVDQVKSFGLTYPAELGKLTAPQLQSIRAQYWKRVDRKIQLQVGQRLVDKNPFNLLRLPLIRRLFPNARTVLIIRHPCDVMLSCFIQHFRAPDLAMLCRDLTTLADAYRRSFDFWYGQVPLLGAETYELKYESFVADFPAEVKRLAEFLRLPWHKSLLAPAEHARAKGFISTPSYTQVVEPVSSRPIGRWRNYERHFQDVLPTVEPYLRRWGYGP
jgi:tetratricopeptide (TPR) repeat protein